MLSGMTHPRYTEWKVIMASNRCTCLLVPPHSLQAAGPQWHFRVFAYAAATHLGTGQYRTHAVLACCTLLCPHRNKVLEYVHASLQFRMRRAPSNSQCACMLLGAGVVAAQQRYAANLPPRRAGGGGGAVHH